MTHALWLDEFRRLAEQADLLWALGADADAHRAAFEAGVRPEDELQAIMDMAQWRGCGCGGA